MKKITKLIIPFVMVLALAFGVLPVYAGSSSYNSPQNITVDRIDATVADVTYNGKKAAPKVVLTDNYGNTIDPKCYTFECQNIDAGPATVKIKMNGLPYNGEFTADFIIKQASPVAATSKTVKKKTVKKKATSITVCKSGAYTKVSKVSGSKKLTVKNGKVVVKKGTKKGTYKIKIKVVGAPPNYYTTTKTITVKVK